MIASLVHPDGLLSSRCILCSGSSCDDDEERKLGMVEERRLPGFPALAVLANVPTKKEDRMRPKKRMLMVQYFVGILWGGLRCTSTVLLVRLFGDCEALLIGPSITLCFQSCFLMLPSVPCLRAIIRCSMHSTVGY